MKRTVVQMRSFSRILDELVRTNKLSGRCFEEFEESLVENPKIGDVIEGCGGIRKARLGGFGKGKSGSYRVIYFDYHLYKKIYLIAVYGKNAKEDLSKKEKKELKELIEILKREAKNG